MKKEKEYGTMTMTDFPDLTLFSGEGSENTGVTAAAAGQQEEDSPIRAQNTQAAAAGENGTRLSWEALMEDPEYNQQMQKTVRLRLKEAGDAQRQLAQLEPALRVLARDLGLDDRELDSAALLRQLAPEAQQARYRQHIESLHREALQVRIPGFDLRRELADPRFAFLTSPQVGMNLEEAYRTVHHRELEARALRAGQRMVADSVLAGRNRPVENGSASQTPAIPSFDYKNASREQKEALRKKIRNYAARGEKLYPGNHNF